MHIYIHINLKKVINNNEFIENQKITVSYISKRKLDFFSSEIAGFNCSSITTETTGEEI